MTVSQSVSRFHCHHHHQIITSHQHEQPQSDLHAAGAHPGWPLLPGGGGHRRHALRFRSDRPEPGLADAGQRHRCRRAGRPGVHQLQGGGGGVRGDAGRRRQGQHLPRQHGRLCRRQRGDEELLRDALSGEEYGGRGRSSARSPR